jgi:hypothetical protein
LGRPGVAPRRHSRRRGNTESGLVAFSGDNRDNSGFVAIRASAIIATLFAEIVSDSFDGAGEVAFRAEDETATS